MVDKPLPGAVIPKAVMKELDELVVVRKELADERTKREQETAQRQKLETRLEEWEVKAQGALVKEQEILKGLGWKKNA